MSSTEKNLVVKLKKTYKKFVKEARKSELARSTDVIERHFKIFRCCISGLILAINDSDRLDSTEGILIRNLQEYFGDFADINAIASNKKISSTIKKLSKIERGRTISSEINAIRENVLSVFNKCVEISLTATPTKHGKRPKKLKRSVATFTKTFEQFSVFVSCLYELYPDIEPKSLNDLRECVKGFISAGKPSGVEEDIRKKINIVVDELIKRFTDDNNDGKGGSGNSTNGNGGEKECTGSESATDTLVLGKSRETASGKEPPPYSKIQKSTNVPENLYANGTYDDIVDELLRDERKLEKITGVDTLKGVIRGLIRIVREKELAIKYASNDIGSIAPTDITLETVVRKHHSFLNAESEEEVPSDKSDASNSKENTENKGLNGPFASASGTVRNKALDLCGYDDKSPRALNLMTSSDDFRSDNINLLKPSHTKDTLSKSTLIFKIKYEKVDFFLLEPSIVGSLIDEGKQRDGIEFLCSSLYVCLVERFVFSNVGLQEEFVDIKTLENVYGQHSNVIKTFHGLIFHVLSNVYRVSAILNGNDPTQINKMAKSVQKSLSETVRLLKDLCHSIVNECFSAIWIKSPEDTTKKVESIINGIERGKFYKKRSWYNENAKKTQRSEWERNHIITSFKKGIARNIARLCDVVHSFMCVICNLPSCNSKCNVGVMYEAISWGISLSNIVNEIGTAYDAIDKLRLETDTLTNPTFSSGISDRIMGLREFSKASTIPLYRELEIEPEIMEKEIYEFDDKGLPQRVSLNKIVAIATDPKTDSETRKNVADIIVDFSFLLAKKHAVMLATLMDRFCVPIPFAEEYGKEYTDGIKQNTVSLITRWVSAQINDLDDSLLDILNKFINDEIMRFSVKEGKMLGDTVYRSKFFRKKRDEIYVLPLSRGLNFDDNVSYFQYVFEWYDKKTIADQMTLATFNLFKKIEFSEFCYNVIDDKYYEYAYYNISRFIEQQDSIANLVGLYIVSKNTDKEKEHAWKRVFSIMDLLERNNNFADLYCLYNWVNLYGKPKWKSDIRKYNELFEQTYLKYMEVYDKTPSPKIPLLVIHSKKALEAYVKSKHDKKVDVKSLSGDLQKVEQLNFGFTKKMYEYIKSMWSARDGSYKIALNPSLYRIFYEPPRFKMNEIDFWNIKRHRPKYNTIR